MVDKRVENRFRRAANYAGKFGSPHDIYVDQKLFSHLRIVYRRYPVRFTERVLIKRIS